MNVKVKERNLALADIEEIRVSTIAIILHNSINTDTCSIRKHDLDNNIRVLPVDISCNIHPVSIRLLLLLLLLLLPL